MNGSRVRRWEIQVLGPLRVLADGHPIDVTAGRSRTVLVVLAMSAGQTVTVSRLAAALWGEDLPGNATVAVRTNVSRLRHAGLDGSVRTRSGGYLLDIDPADVDALRFLRLLDAAAGTTDPSTERTRLHDALALWRGAPFEGVASATLEQAQTPRLVERYLAAVERRIDLDMTTGRYPELVAELRALTSRYPLREPLWCRLLTVLDRCGRQAEALVCYETVRVRIAEELGVEPAPELRQVYAGLLAAGRPAPAGASVAGASVGAVPAFDLVVPRQLPAGPDGFVGRAAALSTLDDMVDARSPGRARIAAITGMPGVGKTSVALHWAHRVSGRFGDGQFYVNLRGFDAIGPAVAPAEAVRGFLEALRVPPDRIPTAFDARVGLYRSLVADKRMLVVLDSARDADQVRDLVPGGPDCVTVITTRAEVTGLTASIGARAVPLDAFGRDEATELLAGRLGRERVAAEPEAVEDIIDACGRLPLALAIVAARAAIRPGLRLADHAARLRGTPGTLDGFGAAGTAADLRTAFSRSYRALSVGAARLFRLLGRQPVTDIDVPAAAALAGVPAARVRPLLAELCGHHLVVEHAAGRYRLHALLRVYGGELAHAYDRAADRDAALRRVLDHYARGAHTAARLVQPDTEALSAEYDVLDRPATRTEAFAWFETERDNLLSVVRTALTGAGWRRAAGVAQAARWLFRSFGHNDAWVAVNEQLARLACDGADPALAAGFLDELAWLCHGRGDFAGGLRYYTLALARYRAAGDPRGAARALINIGAEHHLCGSLNEATGYYRSALAAAVGLNDRRAESYALANLAAADRDTGRYDHAVEYDTRALAVFRRRGDRRGEAVALDGLASSYRAAGRHRDAIEAHRNAVALFRRLNYLPGLADALHGLGATHLAAGDARHGVAVTRTAADLYLTTGNRYGYRAALRQLAGHPAPGG